MAPIVLIETVKSNSIKLLFEALKDIITDTNIYFDSKGMKIKALDESNIALVWLRLTSDGFERFECNVEKFHIGVSVIALWKLLKNIKQNDILMFSVDEDTPNILDINIYNRDKNYQDHNQYMLLDIEEDEMEVPPKEFDWFIRLPSTDLQEICRSMREIGQTVEIMDYKRKLTFRCQGDFATKKRVISEKENGLTYVAKGSTDVDMEQIIRGKFSLKYMLMFTKATGINTKVDIFLMNDYPIILRYEVPDMGELKFVLAQLLDDDT